MKETDRQRQRGQNNQSKRETGRRTYKATDRLIDIQARRNKDMGTRGRRTDSETVVRQAAKGDGNRRRKTDGQSEKQAH